MRRDHATQGSLGEVLLLHLRVADPELLGARLDHALDPWAFDNAWKDRVDPDVGRPEFLGEALGKADHTELGSGVRCAEGVAMLAGGRGHVDDRTAARLLDFRNGQPGAE